MKTQISVLFVLVVGLVPSALAQPFNCGPGYPNYPNEDSAITNLRACVAIAGSTCPVPAGVHCIYKYDTYVALDYYNIGILITASNVTIQGSAASGPSGTVLTRGVPSTGIYGMRDAKTILSAAAGVTGVWIEDLEFDGNRYLVQSPAPPRGVGLGACATSFDGFLRCRPDTDQLSKLGQSVRYVVCQRALHFGYDERYRYRRIRYIWGCRYQLGDLPNGHLPLEFCFSGG